MQPHKSAAVLDLAPWMRTGGAVGRLERAVATQMLYTLNRLAFSPFLQCGQGLRG
jgi:hypothetical protein